MKHAARLNSNKIIALSLVLLDAFLFLSVTANVILAITYYRLQGDRQVVVVPMLFKAPFALSENSMDASYLEQMALSFVALRLNVTPETVEASPVSAVDGQAVGAEIAQARLAKEARQIKKNDVNAAFFKIGVKVYPAQGRVDIRGELKTWFGDAKPDVALKYYSLYLDHSDGVTCLPALSRCPMRKNNRLLGLFVAGVLVCGAAVAGTVNAPVIIPLQNGSQAAVVLSNTEPNLFSVPGTAWWR